MIVDERTFQIAKEIGFVGSLIAVATWQTLRPWGAFPREEGRWWRNLPLALVNSLLLMAVCGACVCAAGRAGREWGGLLASAPLWLSVPATVLAFDALSWAWHRANHGLPFLWRFHAVHHSDRVFDTTTALRFHGGELLLSLPLRLSLAFALGAPIEGILLFEVAFGFFNLFEHGNIALPARFERMLSRVFIAPALHRIHHSRKRAELDSNFGTIFSVWDRLFGTFHDGRSTDEVRIGLPQVPVTNGLVRLMAMPFTPSSARPGPA